VSEFITSDNLRQLAAEWIAQGIRVAGPQRAGGRVLYLPLNDAANLLLDGFIHPANSAKEFLLPKTETLYGYRVEGHDIKLVEEAEAETPQILLAVRPCDVAAFPFLDHIFNWDYADEPYNQRRRNTAIVALSCSTHDANCFCTSVGLGPASERGADVLLVPLTGDTLEVRCVTEKGRSLFAGKTKSDNVAAMSAAGPAPRFAAEAVRKFSAANFEHPLWAEHALACVGCGACAHTCPTCHCFDIVDEHSARVRNWDSCQFSLFTLHASGHNPRPDQGSRQRQRILHKFSIYPDKFGEILCTGCGNCTRHCPAGLGVLPLLIAIEHEEHLPA
jgi:ferredoxin